MTPITPVTVPAGDGLVNARALDGQLRLIVAQVNALIAALGVARGQDNQLADGSLRWRMVSETFKGVVRDIAQLAAEIRRQYKPLDTCNTTFPGIIVSSPVSNPSGRVFSARSVQDQIVPITVPEIDGAGGSPYAARFYRIKARARITGQKPAYVKMWQAVRGTMTLNGTTTVTGVGSTFTDDIDTHYGGTFPARVRINGEIRNLVQRVNDTTLIVSAPFSFTGSGFTLETDGVRGSQSVTDPASAIMQGILRAFPAGSLPQHPQVFSVVADDDVHDIVSIPRRESTEIVTQSPLRRYVLQWWMADDPNRGVIEFYMLPVTSDRMVEFIVEAGSSFSVRNTTDADASSVFCPQVDGWCADDDPRFPLQFRFPCPPCLQLDILSITPWQDPTDELLSEAGFPIQGELPEAALRT